ncbi:hypothetical protein [Streptomyces sp. CA2R101]|uniref:hypothetical protein n=1 Tax=Streptomyces sp. CA2R101 TaxID=3120152 RepID=UPI00300BF9BC
MSAVSTSVRCLGSVTELEPRYFWYLTGNLAQPHSDLTPFAGVHRVLGGEVVELSPTGQLGSRTLRRARRATEPPEPTADSPVHDLPGQNT